MTHARASQPITASERVSDVLARDEALVEVFVRHGPHFTKLRNRAMRRVMARLITVEQAARTARVPVGRLLGDLNQALGFDSAPSVAPDTPDTPDVADAVAFVDARVAHPEDAPVVELDARDDLRAGREPFSKIMSAIAHLHEGEVFHLRAIFEPVPLFTVLANRGFQHESVRHADDDWSVWFWRPTTGFDAEVLAPDTPAPAVPIAGVSDDDATTHWLDVRGLLPPEPIIRTLTALETLPAGHTLVQINSRVPQFLFPVLVERGFACEVDESRIDRVLVRIWHARS